MPGVVWARLTSETPTCSFNYSGEIRYGLIEVVIDDGRVDDITCFGDLFFTESDALRDVFFAVATGSQAFHLCFDRWRDQHDADDVVCPISHLTSALEVNLQDEVLIVVWARHRGAVVLVEDLRPLQETPLSDSLFESRAVDEGICAFVFTRTALTRRPRSRKP